MEKHIIYMRWDMGHAHAAIDISQFFPTSDTRIRKLFNKFILIDDERENRIKVTDQIIEYLEEERQRYSGDEAKLMEYANDNINHLSQERELERKLNEEKSRFDRLYAQYKALPRRAREERKYLNAQTDELSKRIKQLREQVSTHKQAARWALSSFNNFKRSSDLYKRNLELVREFRRML